MVRMVLTEDRDLLDRLALLESPANLDLREVEALLEILASVVILGKLDPP